MEKLTDNELELLVSIPFVGIPLNPQTENCVRTLWHRWLYSSAPMQFITECREALRLKFKMAIACSQHVNGKPYALVASDKGRAIAESDLLVLICQEGEMLGFCFMAVETLIQQRLLVTLQPNEIVETASTSDEKTNSEGCTSRPLSGDGRRSEDAGYVCPVERT